ncbi:protein LIAT1 [Polymixia lowei]
MDKDCKLFIITRNTESKEKKKKRRKQTGGSKKRGHSTTPQNSEDTDTKKPQTTAFPHETSSVSHLTPPSQGQPRGQLLKVRASSGRDAERASGGGEDGRKSKKQPTDSPSTETNENGGGGSPSQGDVSELTAQARESLRWEGALEDPLAEEKRMEVYRANRRQRYLAHRQAMLEETQTALRQTIPK